MINTMQLKLWAFALLFVMSTGVLMAGETDETEVAPVPISRATVPYIVGILDRITIKHTDESVENRPVSPAGTISLGA